MTRVWTLGHSTRSWDQFVACLSSFQIETVVDVRRFPTSRRSPYFSAEPLKKGLFHERISYVFLGDELGGQRRENPQSRHVGLARSGLLGYADWMEMPFFREGVKRLLAAVETSRCAAVCAERPPSGCHRSLLGDYLTLLHGVEVIDILDAGLSHPHFQTPGVHRMADGILYDVRPPATRLDAFGSSGD